jgi:hypothetical protein
MRLVTRYLAVATLAVTMALPVSSGMSEARRSDACQDCGRDTDGRIARSQSAKREFKKQNPLPSKCPTAKDCVVDHIQPLACGGADSPSNMQWQTKDEARAKDKVERKNCR